MGKLKLFLATLCAAVFMACAAPSLPVIRDTAIVEAKTSTPKLTLKKTTLLKGATIKLKVKNTNKTVKWSSSNKKVATVNQKGKVKAKNYGTAKIIARVDGKKLTCKVTVKPTLSVNKTQVSISTGGYVDIKVTYLRPGTVYAKCNDSTCITAKWLSWKGHIATLRVSGYEPGTATIHFTNTYDNTECVTAVTVY